MARIIELPFFMDERGNLTVLDNVEKLLPFPVRRIFFINAVIDAVRGGHRHHKTRQAAICIQGTCVVSNDDNKKKEDFLLNSPNKCLILETGDWHVMHSFSPNSTLLVFASETFDADDYIYEPYKKLVNDSLREFALK